MTRSTGDTENERIEGFSVSPYPRVLSLLLAVLFLASCASFRSEHYDDSGYAVASWYGSEFHGRRTSSGEVFNMYAFTCAHREYPFGTKLKVTNLANGKTVHCVVNDRGPSAAGKDIDLSYAAAKKIGLIGKGSEKVRIEYAGRDNSYIKEIRYSSYTGPFTIQVGSFKDRLNAERLKKALEFKYSEVYISEADNDGSRSYRVRVGTFLSKEEVNDFAKNLADEGYNVFITGFDERR